MKVTLDGEKISAVEVVSHSETAGICEPALETIPAATVEAQSIEADNVSGARAIKAAVADAMAK